MISQDLLKLNLPDSPGVYYFCGPKRPARNALRSNAGRKILYIGKATSLKDRVKSYFGKDLILTRGPRLVKMLGEAKAIKFVSTDSVLEALILEANEIKKHQPYYNSIAKDDRSYNFVTVTDEDFPKIIITRGSGTYGPYPHGSELREALKIIRKIFPYRDAKCKLTGKPCFNAQIGLCPGVCADWMSKGEYRKKVRYIKKFFEGKKTELVSDMEKEMKSLAKTQEFEEANKIKRTLYSLEHIQDIALIKRDIERVHNADTVRIEAYDIAHMSGQNAVGVMTVVEDGELNKSQYRKFKIKLDKNDDVGNLKDVLRRRLGHAEWDLPQIIVVDGGVAQINAAKIVLKERGFNIEIVSVLKDDRHKAKEIIGEKKHISSWGKSILLANAEAHRFAIGYHRKLRGKGFRI